MTTTLYVLESSIRHNKFGIFSSLDAAKAAAARVIVEQGYAPNELWWYDETWGGAKGYHGEVPDDQPDDDRFNIFPIELDAVVIRGW